MVATSGTSEVGEGEKEGCMTTEIIIRTGWVTLVEYTFVFTMGSGDVVSVNDIDYIVDCCILDLAKDKMIILVL